MINNFYSSTMREEVNDLMKKYEVCTNYYTIYSDEFIDTLIDYFNDRKIEANIVIEEYGKMMDRCCFTSWIENNHLQSMHFYIVN